MTLRLKNGLPQVINDLVTNIPNAQKRFKLIFSKKDGHPAIEVDPAGCGKNAKIIDMSSTRKKGRLCSALFKCFDEAPLNIFLKAKSK